MKLNVEVNTISDGEVKIYNINDSLANEDVPHKLLREQQKTILSDLVRVRNGSGKDTELIKIKTQTSTKLIYMRKTLSKHKEFKPVLGILDDLIENVLKV